MPLSVFVVWALRAAWVVGFWTCLGCRTWVGQQLVNQKVYAQAVSLVALAPASGSGQEDHVEQQQAVLMPVSSRNSVNLGPLNG